MSFKYDEEHNVVRISEAWVHGPHPNLTGSDVAIYLHHVEVLLRAGFHVKIYPNYVVIAKLELSKITFNDRGTSDEIEKLARDAYDVGGRHLAIVVGEKALTELSLRLFNSMSPTAQDRLSGNLTIYRLWVGNTMIKLPVIFDVRNEKESVFLVTADLSVLEPKR